MTIHPFALGDRARTITTGAVLAAALLIAAPAPSIAAPSAHSTQVLAQGAGMGAAPSAAVRGVQHELQRRGYDLGAPGVDGRFGPLTDAAVRRMQADFGLTVDGVVGDRTRRALRLQSVAPRAAKARLDRGDRIAHRSVGRPATPPSASTDVAEPGQSRLQPVLTAAALAIVIAALLTLLLTMARRRRHTAGPSTLLHHALSTARTSDEPRRPPTTYLGDRVDTATPPLDADAARSPSRVGPGEPLIGYVTVPADAGAADARATPTAIEEACERAGWNLVEVVRDLENGRTFERPGLAYALELIARGHARGLVVNDISRLSRSIVDLGALMAWFLDAQAPLIALDMDVDTSTSEGRHVAAVVIALGTAERERIAARTRSGLAEVRANGRPTGRPAVRDRPELVERIEAMRSAGMTLQAIADQLNAENVPTLRGGTEWRPSSIQAALGYRRSGTRSPREHLPALGTRETS